MNIVESLSNGWSNMQTKHGISKANKEFIQAAANNKPDLMEGYIRKWGSDLSADSATEALFYMVKNDNVPMIEKLVGLNANINATGWTVSRPCNCGANNCPGDRDASGATPLIVAVADGKENAMNFLLKNGAKAGAKLEDGTTALGQAVYLKHYSMVPALFEAEAHIPFNQQQPAHKQLVL